MLVSGLRRVKRGEGRTAIAEGSYIDTYIDDGVTRPRYRDEGIFSTPPRPPRIPPPSPSPTPAALPVSVRCCAALSPICVLELPRHSAPHTTSPATTSPLCPLAGISSICATTVTPRGSASATKTLLDRSRNIHWWSHNLSYVCRSARVPSPDGRDR